MSTHHRQHDRTRLRLIAHRVPEFAIARLHATARARRQTIAQTLADAIMTLSD